TRRADLERRGPLPGVDHHLDPVALHGRSIATDTSRAGDPALTRPGAPPILDHRSSVANAARRPPGGAPMSVLDAFSLAGRVALAPGGGGAIGTAMALALADAGARVVAANHTLESAEACALAVRDAGGEAIAVRMDATDEADCERAVAETVAAFGKVDIVVN